MYKITYDGVEITVENGTVSEEEAAAYVERGRELYNKKLQRVHLILDKDDAEMVDVHYYWNAAQFHRLRRITGYLVGTLGRWNNAKRAEERDRVKHG